jgi:hypothetical protein
MVSRKKIIFATVSVSVLAIAALCVGLAVGYYAGFSDYLGRDATSSAVYTVAVLKRLRGGDAAGATSMLETQLDTYFMERWAYDRSSHSLTSIFWPPGPQRGLLERAAQYRLEHPSEHPAPDVRTDIFQVVNRYSKPGPN